MSEKKQQASVVLVGCGCPLRSMGWYHAVQILDNRCPSATLSHIVEPWYMSEKSKSSPGWDEFQAWRKELESTHNITFHESVSSVPAASDDEARLGIISARTADNPSLLTECIKIKCKSIYLEKPGAPSVAELEKMRNEAKDANVTVLMGFNKNVSSYVEKARKKASEIEGGAEITFLHNNAYENKEEVLGECFERNSEGMLKNMAIHELALLVTYYDVSVENIDKVTADRSYSSCKTLKGPSGQEFTDFDKLKFTIRTKNGKEANVAADRCGGDDSVGIVVDSSTGKEVARYSMPDEEAVANIPSLEAKNPGAMPYFFAQDPDYATLKERVAKNCVDPSAAAEGVASIDVALESLKVAEYLTPILQDQLLPPPKKQKVDE